MLPTSPFDAAKSIFAGLSVIKFTPTNGQEIVFESRLLNSKNDQEIKDISRPDTAGVLRKVRTVLSKAQESFIFEMDEAKRLLDLFGGALAGRVTGVCTLYLPDPDDESGKVALKSEEDFPCVITRDGDVKFGDADFTKASITIESTKAGAIAWTADADITS